MSGEENGRPSAKVLELEKRVMRLEDDTATLRATGELLRGIALKYAVQLDAIQIEQRRTSDRLDEVLQRLGRRKADR